MRQISCYPILLLLFLIASVNSFAQLAVRVTETYQAGQAFKKIYVSIEDHTVWAISALGKVYYKKAGDTDFAIYPEMSGAVVSDLAGFNASEMYFLEAPLKVTRVSNGIPQVISLPFAGVTRVNNIAVVYQEKITLPMLSREDILCIATNKDMYTVDRGQTAIVNTYQYLNSPSAAERDWRITNSGYHAVDFRYRQPSGGRCFDADYVNLNEVGTTSYQSVIPDKGAYPAKINATLFAHQSIDPPSYGGGRYAINFWGTDNGLYAKNAVECISNPLVKHLLPGEVINSIASLQSLTTLYRQQFIFAATNNGVFYTPVSVFHDIPIGSPALARMSLVAVQGTTGQKVNSLSSDTYEYGRNYAGSSQYLEPVECNKIIWMASETGISKLETTLDAEYYKKLPLVVIGFTNSGIGGNRAISSRDIIPGQHLNMNIRILDHWGQLLIQWFKDGDEVPEWQGKRTAVLTQPGEYSVKVTTLCENITFSTTAAKVAERSSPEITFNYPPEITLCENQTIQLSTLNRPDYTYRWFKDNLQIGAVSASSYTVTAPGRYRVEVSNTPDVFVPSAEVNVLQPTISKPIIISGKNSYCEDETAILSVANPEGLKTQWFRNGAEISSEVNKNTISASVAGQYTVTMENAFGCQKSSDSFSLTFATLPAFSIVSDKGTALCYGDIATLSSSISATAYLWSTGETTPSISVKNEGTYTLELTNATGCKRTTTIELTVLPEINLSEPEEIKICVIAGESVRLTADPGFETYTWNGVEGPAFLDVSAAGDYTLQVENGDGCKASTVYRVVEYCSEVIILNTFTPNNDGVNDQWKIGGIEDDTSAELTIYNRYGNIVFRKKGCCLSWDGTSDNKSLPSGTYFYILQTNRTTSILRGSVSIIR